jgi:beta-glucosidase
MARASRLAHAVLNLKDEVPVKIALLVLTSAVASLAQPYKDPDLTAEKRAADLVSRMTLEEKVLQMQNGAPAIPRLDIPAYDWWNEALHGVARAGQATVFPQAIGLAATWDTSLMRRIADGISTEARAKYNEFIRNDDHRRYHGLTFWSPNINIFRDPRWGRGQETYGEDPFLTGRMAVAFIQGLQGDDPHYYKVIATAKHFAVHSGPESTRHSFDARPSERDLEQTYLPAFRAALVEGKADSVMCAYNRLDGVPACASDDLLVKRLRGQWGFQGYVVSDCGAVADIYRGHKFKPNAAEASAAAVKAGTDLTCGTEYRALAEAVQNGLITEQEIDRSLERLFTARFKLGMFDPPERVPFSQIPYSENDSAAHRQLALEAARESIVLLKNDGTLPLKPSVRRIAVVGPSAADAEALLGNYNGTPSKSVTPREGIETLFAGKAEVRYAAGAPYTSGASAEGLLAEAVDLIKDSDVAILCVGLNPRLEGEEMRVAIPGFAGGDRTDIELPEPQRKLIEAAVATGKPVVVVLSSGSALAVNYAAQHAAAVLQLWYGGEEAGTALAETLSGANNPAGRLPVTFYKSASQLPPFDDYSMNGRTYRYFKGEVLYPFGFGLSYSKFVYSGLRAKRTGVVGSVSVQVKNDSAVEGDEVVQLYVSTKGDSIRDLRGFERVHLKPGETREVSFTIAELPKQKVRLTAGGGQPLGRSSFVKGSL